MISQSQIRRIVILLVLGMFSSFAYAQDAAVLTVDSVRGTVTTGGPCQVERDSLLYLTIQAAVSCALPGDLIAVGVGVFSENVHVDKTLTIQGMGTANTMVDGGKAGRVFTVGDGVTVTFADLTITGGESDSGAGIYTYGGSLIIQRSVIIGNTAVSAGGGIYAHTGSVTITDSTISNNQASVFSNSEVLADASGGGLYLYSGSATIDRSFIIGNRAAADTCGTTPANALGGGIYVHMGDLRISNTAISGNLTEASSCSPETAAVASGQGIYTFAGTVSATETTIDDDTASGENGRIIVEGGIMDIPPAMITIPPAIANEEARIAVRWMSRLIESVRAEQLSPPAAARVYAYAGVTLYEAVLPSMPQNRSLSGQLHAMPQMPRPDANLTYDWPLVANSALAVVASGLFQNTSETALARFTALRDAVEFERAEVVPVNVFKRSQEQGISLGRLILQWASADNYAVTRGLSYTLPTGDPAFWVPLDGQRPLEPFWGSLRTFALPLAASCDVPLTVRFSSDTVSAFYAQAEEVRAAGVNLTPDRAVSAVFWADDKGETSTPPGHWVSIENQLVEQFGLSLGRAAEMYALTGIALADSFISAWEAKYRVQLIRPITYINTYIDPDWGSVIDTPPFPEYPSEHSVVSGAAAVVLTHLFGEVGFNDITHLDRMLPPRQFVSFGQAAQEAGMSRLYGGVHYRVSIENGLAQGRCVGQNTLDRIRLGG